MNAPLHDFDSYRMFLARTLSGPDSPRGSQARLAVHLHCQSSFVSQVLTERIHFSLEHALKIARFLELDADESHFFMLLVQKDKAGSGELADYYGAQIAEIRRKRQIVKERLAAPSELKRQDEATYYSTWWYLAVHILVALPGTQTRKELARRLALPLEVVDRALAFLRDRGLVVEQKGRYRIGATRIHLGTSSPMLPRHHANWRLKAMEAVDRLQRDALHYSALIGVSRADAARIRSMMLDVLQKAEPVLASSKEEAPYVMLMDFFEL